MREIAHRFVETNGIRMHIAEQGEGPLVILCHGFPECWYSWRHQLTALAEAGYHAVAPDQRGYGQTDRPEPIEAYHILELTADMAGLVHALGRQEAVIVGHDWGAPVAWHCGLLRPDLFRAVGLLSVPYLPRPWKDKMRPTDLMRAMVGEKEFYMLYFQEPGKAEAELETDVRMAMRMLLYSGSGDAPHKERWRAIFDKCETLLDTCAMPRALPPWLTEKDIDFFAGEFERTGFRGALNWYRNIDRNWEMTPFLRGAKLCQPTLFAAGGEDGVITLYRKDFDHMEDAVPHLWKKALIPGAGHWIQQERPEEVNALLIAFLQR
jgi:pimeloyl-ACP methyl ester carboxylesterase